MRVFFYGLFMDEALLETKGITPTEKAIGFVNGFELRIGNRATLLRRDGGRAYGVTMTIAPREATELYSEDSVADYVPETVTVVRMDGGSVEATCYNLPNDQVTGANKAYAESLLKLATELGFPDDYLSQIREAARR